MTTTMLRSLLSVLFHSSAVLAFALAGFALTLKYYVFEAAAKPPRVAVASDSERSVAPEEVERFAEDVVSFVRREPPMASSVRGRPDLATLLRVAESFLGKVEEARQRKREAEDSRRGRPALTTTTGSLDRSEVSISARSTPSVSPVVSENSNEL